MIRVCVGVRIWDRVRVTVSGLIWGLGLDYRLEL